MVVVFSLQSTDIIIIVTLIATTDFDPIVRERRAVTECGGVSPNSAVGDASPNGSTGATSGITRRWLMPLPTVHQRK